MDCFDDDIFEFSDKDEDVSVSKTTSHKEFNPIEEHLVKQLNGIRNRIDKAKNELEEMKETIGRVSNNLAYKAVFGRDKNIDSDDDLYTVEGEPVLIKKQEEDRPCNFLLLKEQWRYVLFDKWIMGVVLKNVSFQTLNELRFYALPRGTNEIHGCVSAFWVVDESDDLWKRIDSIPSKKDNVVATLVIDPLDFDGDTNVEIHGTISYENMDTELQTTLSVFNFASRDIMRGAYKLNHSLQPRYTALALKSVLIETIVVELPYRFDSENFNDLLRSVDAKKILNNVYYIDNAECYAIMETFSTNRITISAKTMPRLMLILRTIQEVSSIPVTRLDESNRVKEAAEALIEELEMYLGDTNLAKIQRARIKSDLLIP